MKLNKATLIAPGCWNKRLFTPSWLIMVAPSIVKKETIMGMVNPQEHEYGFKIDDLRIFPKDNQLEILNTSNTKNSYENLIVLFNSIQQTLPHTPIKNVLLLLNYEISDTNKNLFISSILKNIKNFDKLKVFKVGVKRNFNNNPVLINIDFMKNYNIIFLYTINISKLPLSPNIFNEFVEFSKNTLTNEIF